MTDHQISKTNSTTDDSAVPITDTDTGIEPEAWKSKWEYFLSCVSYGVGLGNLWRFPYLCFQHHGITFLIPYLTCLFLCGLPLCLLEAILGQFSGYSAIKIWDIAPIFEGLGWGATLMTFMCTLYYQMIIAYALIYLYESIKTIFTKSTLLPFDDDSVFCKNFYQHLNDSSGVETCAENYYNEVVLQDFTAAGAESDSKMDFTSGLLSMNYKLVFFTLLGWLIIFYSQKSGTKSTGKTAWVTSLLPYFCLTSLLIGTLFQDGAISVGVKKYLTLNTTHLFEPSVWSDASQQIFYSQGVVWGCFLTFASHNPYRTDIYGLSWRLSIVNAATSIYGGFLIFGTIGMRALIDHKTVELALANFDKMIAQTYKLAFVVYPVAVTQMSFPVFWSILFFLMLSTLGIGTQMGMVMGLYEAVMQKVDYFKRNPQIWLYILIGAHLLIQIPLFCNQAGIKWLTFFDWSICAISMFIFGLVEIIAISWVYGIDNFNEDTNQMIGKIFYSKPPNNGKIPLHKLWTILWKYVTPCMIFGLVCNNLFGFYNRSFQISNSWPLWVNLLGWVIIQAPQLALLIIFIIKNWGQTKPLDSYYQRQQRSETLQNLLAGSNTDSMDKIDPEKI